MDRRMLRMAVLSLLCIFLLADRTAQSEQIRLAMPSKSMTFLNFYVAEKFGFYKAEGLEVSFAVGKADVQLAAVVAGEMDYITAIGTVLRAAATGVPVKALMFTVDKTVFYLMAKSATNGIQDLKGKAVAVSGVAATDALGARAMAKATGLNPDQDLAFMATGNAANSFAALQGGSVAAAMLSLPFNFKAEGLGYRNLGNMADYVRTPFTGLATGDGKIRSNPGQIKRAIRATLQGMEFAKDAANQERVIAYMKEDFQLDRKTTEVSYREIVKTFAKEGMTTEDAVRSEIDSMREQAKLKGQVPIGQVIDYGLLREVLAGK